jgi:hypothetical protein
VTFIAPIVEGHGEQQAVRRLLLRIASDARAQAVLRINEPIRIKSGSFVNDQAYFNKYMALAAAKARQQPDGHVLVLLDCEDDCPAQLGPQLLARAQSVAADVSTLVVLAHREYETWFMAAVVSLRNLEGMAADVVAPARPEAMRDAKGWLGRQMLYRYDPISHQLAFTNAFDLNAARTIPSFDRLCRKIASIVKL